MVGLLLVGVVFGWVASSSMQNREIYNARSDDAARIHEALKPKVATLDEAKKLIGQFKPTEPNYELNQKLADLEIAPDGNLLGGNRLLLGPEIIDYVTSYTVDASMLEQMLDEHAKATKADKKELEQLVKGNEVVKKDRFAVLFDYDHLAQRSGSEDYMPKQGRLVTVSELEKDDDGKIEVELLNSDRTVKTNIQGILPLPKGDILDTGGPNALKRYQQRVGRIQRQLLKFENYRGTMMTKLKELGSQDSAPLLNF
jgi:flagellar biosynthesis chaperone FliJ